MDIQLILGPNGSGKSLYAETLAMKTGRERVYLATMLPRTEDNYRRIEKHRLQRQDKGFVTREVPWEIDRIFVAPGSTVLLEDVSNLLSNGMFAHGADEKEALQKILTLAGRCGTLVAVSISGLSPAGYDGETAEYIQKLNWLNSALLEKASFAVEMAEGKETVLKE